ncbi:Minor capsid protein P3-RTD, partial [Frankliniella fusca]
SLVLRNFAILKTNISSVSLHLLPFQRYRHIDDPNIRNRFVGFPVIFVITEMIIWAQPIDIEPLRFKAEGLAAVKVIHRYLKYFPASNTMRFKLIYSTHSPLTKALYVVQTAHTDWK